MKRAGKNTEDTAKEGAVKWWTFISAAPRGEKGKAIEFDRPLASKQIYDISIMFFSVIPMVEYLP